MAEQIDDEVKELIGVAYRRAEELLVTNKPKLVKLAEYLIEHETLSGENLNRLFNDEDFGDEPGSPAVPPEVSPDAPAYTAPPQPAVPQPAPSLSSQSDPGIPAPTGEDGG